MRFEAELGQGAKALFSTRIGGVSEGPYESLNLGLLTGDDRTRVLENRGLLAADADVDEARVAMGWQVHGTDIREWDGPDADQAFLDPQGGHLKVDGHVTSEPDLALLVLVADCLPVAIAGHGVVAMLHCGWRGLAGGLIAKAAAQLAVPRGQGLTDRQTGDTRMRGVGTDPPTGLCAAVGPGIGSCCYQVGDDVLDAFAAHPDAADGRMLDLRAIADAQLRAAGVEHVEHVDMCTSCREDLFFSHRRDDGVTGRQGGMAWLTG